MTGTPTSPCQRLALLFNRGLVNGIQPSSRADLRFLSQPENAPVATTVTGAAIRAALLPVPGAPHGNGVGGVG